MDPFIECMARVCDPQCQAARNRGRANEAVRFFRNRKGKGRPQGQIAMAYCEACWQWCVKGWDKGIKSWGRGWRPTCWVKINRSEAVAYLTVTAVMET